MSAQREVDVVCKTKENICARLSLRAILRARSALFAQLSLAQIFPPCPNKQINTKKERILIINQAPRPPHVKPPPKKKKFENLIQSKTN